VLGYGYALSGRLAEGLPLLEGAVQQQERIKQMTGHALRLASLGEAYLLNGQRGEALTLASRALALAREQKERGNEAYALRLVAVAAAGEPDEHAEAERHFRLAMALAEELAMRPLLARCLLGLGHLHTARGERRAAGVTLRAAADLLRPMDMGMWRAEVEAALGGLE
jgi:tetratricopeptide (TPR) repeat protein